MLLDLRSLFEQAEIIVEEAPQGRVRRVRPQKIFGWGVAELEGVEARGEGRVRFAAQLDAILLTLDAAGRADLTVTGALDALLALQTTSRGKGRSKLRASGVSELEMLTLEATGGLKLRGECKTRINVGLLVAARAVTVHRENENAVALLLLDEDDDLC